MRKLILLLFAATALPSFAAVSWQDPPVTALYSLAADLSRVIPPGSRVFHLGGPLGLYLAGLDLYVRQERGLLTLMATSDDGRFARSGLWDLGDIRRWLTEDSDYAVIAPTYIEPYRGSVLDPGLAFADKLLAARFIRIASIDRYPGLRYEVYRRVR